jgi:transcriptional regulator with XRE-family HTH domain
MGKEGLTMTTKQQTFGARLRAARKAAELTQVDAAKRAQVTQGAWSEYESGSHQPSLPLVRRLAAAVGVKPSDLLD